MSEPRHIDSDFAALLREELVYLWADLYAAKQRARAADGWSVDAEGVRDRIEEITRAVGAIRWQQVQVDLLEDYERLHAEWGVPFEPVDWEHINRLRRFAQGGVIPKPGPVQVDSRDFPLVSSEEALAGAERLSEVIRQAQQGSGDVPHGGAE